jgi:hypothetical protein
MSSNEANLMDPHNDEMVNLSRLLTTETNMMPDYLADTEKLVSPGQRWYFAKGSADKENNYEHIEEQLDDDFNRYKTPEAPKEQTKKEASREEKPTPKIDSEKFSAEQKPSQQTQQGGLFGSSDENLTREEKILRNLDMFRKLGELKSYGVKLSQNYKLDSNYDQMKYEYELHTGIKAKSNAVQWMGGMLVTLLKGVEMLNDKYNPFDIKLAGWSEKVGSDINNYYEVIGDIYEKYNQPGKKMAPELKLFLMISMGAVGMQLHRGAMKLMPNDAENLENDEGLVEQLRSKAAEDSRQNDALHKMSEKEHDAVNQKLRDLQELREQELEYHRMQKFLAEENSKFKSFKSGLELSPDSVRMSEMKPTSEQRDIMRKQEALRQQFEQEKLLEAQRQHTQLNKIIKHIDSDKKRSSKKTDTENSDASNMSSVSINKNLANTLKAVLSEKTVTETDTESLSNPSSNSPSIKKAPKKPAHKEITLDAISFGVHSKNSRGRGKKGGITIGKN